MNTKLRILVPLLLPLVLGAQRPWQETAVPSVREAAGNFRTPPREYGAIHWAIWGGELTQARIVKEFDQLVANGIYVVNLAPARGMTPKYFSPEHFALMKFAVEEARKRGMKVWLADEGSYPSGFAGGQISQEYPQLTMQGIVAAMPPPPPGDAARGRAIFAASGECTNCHRVNGTGSRIGPELSDVGARTSPADLLASLLRPDERVLPTHWYVRVVTRDGRTFTGRRLNEDTYSVQLIDGREKLVSLVKGDLQEYELIKKSPMPSYEGKLTAEQLGDLVAYLASLTGTP